MSLPYAHVRILIERRMYVSIYAYTRLYMIAHLYKA